MEKLLYVPFYKGTVDSHLLPKGSSQMVEKSTETPAKFIFKRAINTRNRRLMLTAITVISEWFKDNIEGLQHLATQFEKEPSVKNVI